MIINAIIAILIIGFLVVAHEFGHFIVAKANGVAVVEFAIGFGPRIFHIKKGETDYALRLIPFGGACVMLGDTMMDSGDTDIEYDSNLSADESYVKQQGSNGLSKVVYRWASGLETVWCSFCS